MTRLSAFVPDWACPPGATVARLLASRSWTETQLAEQLGWKSQEVSALLVGDAPITPALANRLAAAVGGAPSFWITRERQYREALGRLSGYPATARDWLRTLPIKDMIASGWIPRERTAEDQAAAALSFFGSATIAQWQGDYSQALQASAFRTSPSFKSSPGALAAWLRRGEIEAEAMSCEPWNRVHLRETVPAMRELTRHHRLESFLPRLVELCRGCGVAFVVVRAPAGCRASGATRLLSPTRAMLLASFRHLTDDQFWFSFFHEVGHLLLHNLDDLFVEVPQSETSTNDDPRDGEPDPEDEANEFAAQTLVPPSELARMLDLPASSRAIIGFAMDIGVSPGIVVGQLQHHGRLPFDKMNRLKRRYQWT